MDEWYQDLWQNLFGYSGEDVDIDAMAGQSPWSAIRKQFDLSEQDFPEHLVPKISKSMIDPTRYKSYKESIEAGVVPKAQAYQQNVAKMHKKSNLDSGQFTRDLDKAKTGYEVSTAPLFSDVQKQRMSGRQNIDMLVQSIKDQAGRIKGW